MTDVMTGLDAIGALNDDGGGGNGPEFKSFKTGTSFKVKVLGTEDIVSAFTYGIFKKVNSFSAENPSKKSAKGYPVEKFTPWDHAWKYHKDLSEDWADEHGQEASKYRPKQRFALGFFDLESGEEIIVDLSKKQAQAVYSVIKKNEKKLDKKAFELEKSGTSTATTVTLSPEDLEDLTEAQQKNFENAPAEFNKEALKNVFVTKTEDEQVELLKQAGFDVTLIGYGGGESEGTDGNEDDPTKNF